MSFRFRIFRVKRKKSKSNRLHYTLHKEKAREIAKNRLEFFNLHYKYKIGRVSIRNQKSRWGSCSRAGNLNFNYRIAIISSQLADYIIVHELCHIGQFNHSKKFWDLVGETMPNYLKLQKELRKIRMS